VTARCRAPAVSSRSAGLGGLSASGQVRGSRSGNDYTNRAVSPLPEHASWFSEDTLRLCNCVARVVVKGRRAVAFMAQMLAPALRPARGRTRAAAASAAPRRQCRSGASLAWRCNFRVAPGLPTRLSFLERTSRSRVPASRPGQP